MPHCLFKAGFRQKLLATLIVASLLSSVVEAQTAQRSTYTAGTVSYGHFVMNTDVGNDRFVYFEDVNGDGFTDVIVTGYTPTDRPSPGPQPGQILLNNGDNTFRAATGDRPLNEWAREILVADFNNDGIQDIFIADHGWDAPPYPGFRNQLLLGTGQGFTDATDRLPGLSDFSHNAAVGDVNGDGFVDILVTNTPQGNAARAPYLLMNRGNAQFDLDRTRLPESFVRADFTSEFSWAVELADLDKDGHVDMIVGRKQGLTTLPSRIYWNPGNGEFSNAQVTHLPDMRRFVSGDKYEIIEIQAFDVNQNGRLDLIMTAYNSNFRGTGIQLLSNLGNRQFVDSTDVCLSGITQDPDNARNTPFHLRNVDVNFDGVSDVVAIFNNDPSEQTTLFFEGSGARLRALTRASLGGDAEARLRLLWGQPLVGKDVFGYAEVFVLVDNGQRKLGLNYVPVTSTPAPSVANRFDVCSNQMRSFVDAGELGRIQLDFQLLRMEPTVQIQVLPETIKNLSVLPSRFSTFSPATGILQVPELVVDDTIEYRGLRFQLIDGDRLIFELIGSE
ncbi:VCBS repeat-containing protein [Gammaproteobacteria bacterium LSUCC0112]|nr:VCBS repeat-containing protein [Gammaproteobacteria bacterium LSUCC0112]